MNVTLPPYVTKRPVLLLVVFLSLRLGATTHYVAKNGHDYWPGTAVQPWLTITYMAEQVQAGDTCWVKQGTYDEDVVSFYNAGTATNPIALLSYDGWNTIVHTPIRIVAPHYFISGFKFVVEVDDTLDGATIGVKFDQGVAEANSCTIRNCLSIPEVAHSINGGNGFHVGHRTNVVMESCEAYGWGRTGSGNQGHGIYIQGSHGAVRWGKWHDNIGVGIHEFFEGGEERIDHNEIADNLCYNGDDGHSGIIIKGDSDLVHDNITYDNSGDGIMVYWGGGLGAKVYNNTSYRDEVGLQDGSDGPNAIKNNIILGSVAQAMMANNDADTIDYNCYCPDGADRFQWGGLLLLRPWWGIPVWVLGCTAVGNAVPVSVEGELGWQGSVSWGRTGQNSETRIQN
jgi:hypothetical protein